MPSVLDSNRPASAPTIPRYLARAPFVLSYTIGGESLYFGADELSTAIVVYRELERHIDADRSNSIAILVDVDGELERIVELGEHRPLPYKRSQLAAAAREIRERQLAGHEYYDQRRRDCWATVVGHNSPWAPRYRTGWRQKFRRIARRGDIDHTSIKNFDTAADGLAETYPEILADDCNPTDALWEIITSDYKPAPTMADARREADKYLRALVARGELDAYKPAASTSTMGESADDDLSFDFGSNLEF